ncbi:hypothetical protein EG329_007717 [Mollisiaceae sp. DMI_Dod_QoI]|nr:hypothetical protein EG329_007717 [Helotiales sp. DMI_Dod_QoI]
MTDIYGAAEAVVPWLIPSTPSIINQDVPEEQRNIEFVVRKYSDGQLGRSVYGVPLDGSPALDTLHMFNEILKNHYWTRVWIIQEVGLAKKLQCRYGRRFFSWESFESLRHHHEALEDLVGLRENGTKWVRDRVERFGAIASLHSSHGTMPLAELIWAFMSVQSKCKVPHDHAFGLLGLASPCCRSALRVEYSAPISKVAESIFKHYFDVHHAHPKIKELTQIAEIRRALEHLALSQDSVSSDFLDSWEVAETGKERLRNIGLLGKSILRKGGGFLVNRSKEQEQVQPREPGQVSQVAQRLRDLGMLRISNNWP